MQNAAAGRVELVARTFAETGVRDLFLNILHLIGKYQDKARIVRLQGKYVSVDPREWKSQYDVYINVGLGTGTREQQLTMLSMILQKQEATTWHTHWSSSGWHRTISIRPWQIYRKCWFCR
jgi:hypothetical protein